MKKKTVKKLVLAKETVRQLEAEALGNVAGAVTEDRCVTWRYCGPEPNLSKQIAC